MEQQQEEKVKIELKASTVNLCMNALGELPFKVSNSAIVDLQTQIQKIQQPKVEVVDEKKAK